MNNNLPLAEMPIPIKGRVVVEIHDAKTGKLKSRDVIDNMYVTAGKYTMAQFLAGQSVLGVTYCALGTSSVAPALGDTGLTTEIVRKLISVRSFATNVATFQTFFNTSEGNGSLREAGLFGDTASAIPGSGSLFAKLAISRTKTTNDTLTLTWTLTVG